jgi:hypothetical protein
MLLNKIDLINKYNILMKDLSQLVVFSNYNPMDNIYAIFLVYNEDKLNKIWYIRRKWIWIYLLGCKNGKKIIVRRSKIKKIIDQTAGCSIFSVFIDDDVVPPMMKKSININSSISSAMWENIVMKWLYSSYIWQNTTKRKTRQR